MYLMIDPVSLCGSFPFFSTGCAYGLQGAHVPAPLSWVCNCVLFIGVLFAHNIFYAVYLWMPLSPPLFFPYVISILKPPYL